MGPPEKTPREMKVLALGLPRTGTLSMAEALTTLGYENVYHTLKSTFYQDEDFPKFYSRAADAIFPRLPTYAGQPLTRVDQMVLRRLWSTCGGIFVRFVEPVLGLTTITTMRKMTLAFFEADTVQDVPKNAQMAYDRHHRVIREMVPPERLLFYSLGDGWEPLCRFLGKPVPDLEFPRVNDARALEAMGLSYFLFTFKAACWVVPSRALGPAAIVLVLWMTANKYLF
ncbi:hypothetical protein HRG_000848 [Hirsutella rhossiliensis]|uniref:NAD dependent epimerase/dehydratase n=1 Tax=Hirsutella rhossiliensis TaxID=111463 RepID=A0A9P8SMN9_9HYPO|nr:uncharacterized protein HRG_00848 [Hirsutella rhossiliensis]KAH0968206.1 hypothetical protein HRG_00848 [Hirsutella rhossiliensis]